MNEDLREIAAQLTRDLELENPPVQVSYLETPPTGVAQHPGGAPSVCSFFAEGKDRSFFAGTAQHEDCEVGAFVMGLPPEGKLGERLGSTIGLMQREGYLNPGEEAHIPHNAKAPRYVAYGPLGTLDVPPTGVLLFANPKSAMLAVEAAQSGPGGAPVPLNGRPMCAVLPILNQGAPVAISWGCIGSRIFTAMGDHQLVVGIRGDHLAPFAQKVAKIRAANRAIGAEDERRRNEAVHPYQPKTR